MRISGTKIRMIRGDSEAMTVILRDADHNSIPFEDGDTVYFTVKENSHTAEKLVWKKIQSFSNEGIAHIDIDPEDTKDLNYGRYVYDVQVTFKDGTVKTIIPMSSFTIEDEVTYD